MRDGSRFNGDFVDGEICGKGTRTYECGMTYTGDWLNGEREGQGECKYGRRNYTDIYYNGAWCSNVRHGKGEIGLRNGNVIKGHFENNLPHGDCTIQYQDGGCFTGRLNKGVPEGEGTLVKDGFVYTGTFVDGKREGEGALSIKDSTYMFKSLFVEDMPEFESNKFTCEVVGPKVEEPVVDLKAKAAKDAPKPTTRFTEHEEATFGANKIYYEFKRAVEAVEGSTDAATPEVEPEVIITLSMWYQGPDYEDPNPPEEVIPDPKAKKAPTKGTPAVPDEPPAPRMITPPSVIMKKESGRTFRVELGRMEKDQTIEEPSQDHMTSQDAKKDEKPTIPKDVSCVSIEPAES